MLKYYGKFDTAMVAFAHCVQELEGHVATLDPKFAPPYRIEGDKVQDHSIRLQFNSHQDWSKALKYLLTNLKWLIAWKARQETARLS
mmetsp:Transcript_63267/g.137608  ORF Transcript_63267/g.137608 Transcript_63267/m.137608 type:complete len:87 (+) Transcript_63267:555-815(+)